MIIIGASGAGKTFIGCALGVAACRQLFTVKYVRLPELLTDLAIARGDSLYKKVIEHYKKYKLLIFDKWLLTPLNEIEARDLLEIIEARHQESSTIFWKAIQKHPPLLTLSFHSLQCTRYICIILRMSEVKTVIPYTLNMNN